MNFWGGHIIHIQPTFHHRSWLRRLSKHSTPPHFSRCGGIQSMPGGLKLYNGVGIFIQIIPEAAALVFVFSVSAWHFSLSSRNSTGCWTKTITPDRQRVKDREKERKKYRENDSQSTSRCSVIASDSTSFPSTTDDRAVTFASRARACSSRKSDQWWASLFQDVLRLRSCASW